MARGVNESTSTPSLRARTVTVSDCTCGAWDMSYVARSIVTAKVSVVTIVGGSVALRYLMSTVPSCWVSR